MKKKYWLPRNHPENVKGEWDLVGIAWNLNRLNVLRQIMA